MSEPNDTICVTLQDWRDEIADELDSYRIKQLNVIIAALIAAAPQEQPRRFTKRERHSGWMKFLARMKVSTTLSWNDDSFADNVRNAYEDSLTAIEEKPFAGAKGILRESATEVKE